MGKRVGGKMGEEMQAVWMGGWINSGGITGTNGLAGQGTGQQASGCLDGGWATDREQVRGVLAPSVLLPASLGNPEQGPRLPCRQRPGEPRTAVNSVQSPGGCQAGSRSQPSGATSCRLTTDQRLQLSELPFPHPSSEENTLPSQGAVE